MEFLTIFEDLYHSIKKTVKSGSFSGTTFDLRKISPIVYLSYMDPDFLNLGFNCDLYINTAYKGTDSRRDFINCLMENLPEQSRLTVYLKGIGNWILEDFIPIDKKYTSQNGSINNIFEVYISPIQLDQVNGFDDDNTDTINVKIFTSKYAKSFFPTTAVLDLFQSVCERSIYYLLNSHVASITSQCLQDKSLFIIYKNQIDDDFNHSLLAPASIVDTYHVGDGTASYDDIKKFFYSRVSDKQESVHLITHKSTLSIYSMIHLTLQRICNL